MCRDCRKRYAGWAKLTVRERLARMRRKPRTGDGYHVALVMASGNRKTGRMPVSTTDMRSCPDACPFKNHGCYAEFGKVRMHWSVVPKRGTSWTRFCARILALPSGTLWRHNEAGDLPGRGDRLDGSALMRLVDANRGKRGFTFTHQPMLGNPRAGDRAWVRIANRNGFTINLSANNLRQADELAALDIGPVAVVLPSGAPDRLKTPQGRDVIVCLNETKQLTCLECQLCAVATRKAIVGFRAHGQAKAIVSELVTLRTRKSA